MPDRPAAESPRIDELIAQIHDQVIPPLFAARMQLEVLLLQLRSGQPPPAADQLENLLGQTLELVDRASDSSRRLLQPPDRDGSNDPGGAVMETGDLATIYWQQQFTPVCQLAAAASSRTGRPLQLDVIGSPVPAQWPTDQVRPLVDLLCEAIRNAIRHAHASRIVIRFDQTADRCITVQDDGIGLGCDWHADHLPPASGNLASTGSRLMQQRATQLGVRLLWKSSAQGGTTFQVRW